MVRKRSRFSSRGMTSAECRENGGTNGTNCDYDVDEMCNVANARDAQLRAGV